MSTLEYIIIFTVLGSVGSLIGGLLLLLRADLTKKISHLLASFAAGTLLGTAFFELLPEAVEESGDTNVFAIVLLGILLFFLLERFLHTHHHPHKNEEQEHKKHTIALVTIGDTMHNIVDGIVIASTFLVSIPLGIATSIAVIAHEVPQEIGDFGLLLHQGLSRKKVVIINIFSALSALAAALVTYAIGEQVESLHPLLLSLAAGFFIYISLANLIPEIHEKNKRGFALLETIFLFLGVIILWLLTSYIEHGHA